MNYIKIFNNHYWKAEEEINSFLLEVSKKGHCVMKTHCEFGLSEITVMLVLNDEPHPHKKLKDKKENI